jgi:hypothetical protein
MVLGSLHSIFSGYSFILLSELSNAYVFYAGLDSSVLDGPGSNSGLTTFFSSP